MRVSVSRRARVVLTLTLILFASGFPHSLGAEVRPELWAALELARPTSRLEAPDFTLSDLAGKPISLRDLRGRVVLLYFWATW